MLLILSLYIAEALHEEMLVLEPLRVPLFAASVPCFLLRIIGGQAVAQLQQLSIQGFWAEAWMVIGSGHSCLLSFVSVVSKSAVNQCLSLFRLFILTGLDCCY